MRTWSSSDPNNSSLSSSFMLYNNNDDDNNNIDDDSNIMSSINLESQLKQVSEHIAELESVLTNAEKQQSSSHANHQLAHYRAILITLYHLTQTVSNQFKYLRTLEAQRILYARKLFTEVWVNKGEKPSANEQKQLSQLQNEEQVREEEERTNTIQVNYLSDRQMLLLKSENNWLQEEIEQWLQDALDAEKSAVELGELIALFDQKVSEQAEQIELLYENAKNSEEAMSNAKDELEKAKKTSQGKGDSWLLNMFGGKVLANLIRYFVFYLLIGASFFLLFLDLISK